MKTCVKCNIDKPLTDYYKNKKRKDGFDYYCKECRIGSALKSHRIGVRKKACELDGCDRNHYAKGMCRVHYTRQFRYGRTSLANDRKKDTYTCGLSYKTVRKSHLRNKYKVTEEQYLTMAQNGCEICGKMSLPHKKLHIDHDHKCCPVVYDSKGRTGYFKTCGRCVRGVLCDGCNNAVGKYERDTLRDDYPHRHKIIVYVAKYSQIISDRIDTYEKEQRQLREGWRGQE